MIYTVVKYVFHTESMLIMAFKSGANKTTDVPSTSNSNSRVAILASTNITTENPTSILPDDSMTSSSSSQPILMNEDATTFEQSLSSKNNNNNNDDKTRVKINGKRDNVAPIIIGAGLGTTGTHFFTEVTCHLGYTSIHYNAACIPNKQARYQQQGRLSNYGNHSQNSQEQEMSLNITSISNSSETVIAIPKLYKNLQYNQRCLLKQLRAMWSSHLPPALYRNQTLDLLEGIIVFGKENQIFLALHDTPYPFLMPHIIKLVQKHYNGSHPILLLSEREPHSYTKRRVEMHGQSHVMCKNTTTVIDPITLEGGVFDIIGCIDRALDGMPEHEATQLHVRDLFESMTQAYEEKGMDYVVKEVEQYQNAVRGLADFAFDMFARKDKTKVEELAALMHSNISSGIECDEDRRWQWLF